MVYFPNHKSKAFAMLKEEDYLADFNVNVLKCKSSKKVINNLKEAEGASVVFVSSVAANLGLPYHASIAASKSALEGLAKSLASEYASKGVSMLGAKSYQYSNGWHLLKQIGKLRL